MRFSTSSASILALLAGSAIAAPSRTPELQTRDDTSSIDSAIPPVVPVNTRSKDKTLIFKLETATNQVERFSLLDQPGDHVFDFRKETAPASASEPGGFSISATSQTFPALIGNGEAMTVAYLAPCGMNTAHVHPRATELNIVVQGRLVTNFIMENTAAPIANTMETFQMSVFPQGSIHQEYNPDCTETIFVAAFNNVDPGVNTIAENFFMLNDNVVQASLGGVSTFDGKDIDSFRAIIPKPVALGIDECLNRCGIKRNAKRDLSEFLNMN